MVAQGIQRAHFETSHLQYNDENALSYTISLALYAARNYYSVYRELPTGKGFADMVFIPRKKFPDKPALVVELKWDKSAKGAISQIKQKQYCKSLEEYAGNMNLLVQCPRSIVCLANLIYVNRINSRGMSRVFCDLRSQKTLRGILPVNSNDLLQM